MIILLFYVRQSSITEENTQTMKEQKKKKKPFIHLRPLCGPFHFWMTRKINSNQKMTTEGAKQVNWVTGTTGGLSLS